MEDVDSWSAARNILAVRLDNAGDVLMLGPALRAVKETSPSCRITLLGTPAGAGAGSLVPWIDDVIQFRPVWQGVSSTERFDDGADRDLIRELRERKFDAALIFTSFSQSPHPPGYLCYLAGIPFRAGESKEFGGLCLTTQLSGAPDEMHQVERNLRLVEHLGFGTDRCHLEVSISAAARLRMESALGRPGFHPQEGLVLLHPGASAQARRYPATRFGEVAQLLINRGQRVVVTGTERESDLVDEVTSRASGAVGLAGVLDLEAYAALVESVDLVVCNDSLPMHLADAVRTPQVVLFSGTDRESQWRPRSAPARLLRRPTGCHPCYLMECPVGLPCLDIEPAEVAAVAEQLLVQHHRVGAA